MSTPARRTGRILRDVEARERLRQAQDAEARAVSAVCVAADALAAARRKRDKAVAAADAIFAEAERDLAAAQAHVVAVSGLDRASTLLGLNRAALRRARAAGATSRDGGDAA